jgi:hypothetical protein
LLLFDPCFWSLEVELSAEGLYPVICFFLVFDGAIIRYDVLDDGKSIFSEIMLPSSAFLLCSILSYQQCKYPLLRQGAYKNLVGKGASTTFGSSGRRADGAIFMIQTRL